MFTRTVLSLSLILGSAAATQPATAEDLQSHGAQTYRIEITNVTRSIDFTPFLVVAHDKGHMPLFQLGQPASDELAVLAEGGDVSPLQAALDANPVVTATAASMGLAHSRDVVEVEVHAQPGRDSVSLAAMLLPTNDGMVAAQDIPLPHGRETVTVRAIGYDAGSEPNDELCANIPGPVCGGAGGSPGVGGEDFVHVHNGIHGIGDLDPATYDWRNPVAVVRITRVR